MAPRKTTKTPQAKQIRIIGAREHNLKNVSLDLPRDKLDCGDRPVRLGQKFAGF